MRHVALNPFYDALSAICLNISFSLSLCYSPCSCSLFPARFCLLRGCTGGSESLQIPCSVVWKILWRGICNKEVKNKEVKNEELLELIGSRWGIPHSVFTSGQNLPPLTGASMQPEVCLDSFLVSPELMLNSKHPFWAQRRYSIRWIREQPESLLPQRLRVNMFAGL